MKKLLTVIVFFTVFSSFSQSITLDKLMSLNGSSEIFDRLINSSVPNIATDKQADFRSKAQALSSSKKMEAQQYFQKKYSQKDVEDIYNELNQPEILSYSEKTNSFIKEWRNFKAEYQIAFKELYSSYQN